MKTVLLKDIKHDLDGEITDWPFVENAKQEVRVYYKADDGDLPSGFCFYCVAITAEYSTEREAMADKWSPAHTAVECLFRGVAYFDSIRHLYVGDEQTDNAGYLYYPDLDKMVAALRMLRKLERKFCQLSG